MNVRVIEPVEQRIALENPEECWLWCEACRRFLRYATISDERCPFSDCFGVGFGFTLYMWDDMREPADPRWPSGVDELHHGMKSPKMERFYAERTRSRIDDMVHRFQSSPEAGRQPPRYVAEFLHMMSALCWDLTEHSEYESFDPQLARELIRDLPDRSRTRDPELAADMAAELRAFFAFAARTRAVDNAQAWCDLLASFDLAEVFEQTINADHRRWRRELAPYRQPRTRPKPHARSKPLRDPRTGMRRPPRPRRRGRR